MRGSLHYETSEPLPHRTVDAHYDQLCDNLFTTWIRPCGATHRRTTVGGLLLGEVVVGVFEEATNCVGELHIASWRRGLLITRDDSHLTTIEANQTTAVYIIWRATNTLIGGMIERVELKSIFEFEPREGREYHLGVQAETLPFGWLITEIQANGERVPVTIRAIKATRPASQTGMYYCEGNEAIQDIG